MPLNEQEPQYQLTDSNGNVLANFYADVDGGVLTGINEMFGPGGEGSGDAVTFEAVNAGEVSNGIAGSNNAITGIWGNQNEYVPLLSFSFGIGSQNLSTTSTTYTELTNNDMRPAFDFSQLDLTNITGLYCSWGTGEMLNDTTDETLTARPRFSGGDTGDQYGPEITVTGSATTFRPTSSLGSVDLAGSTGLRLEAKVSAGTGTIRGNPHIHIWGQVGGSQ